MQRVILTTGGTGGHIFPALAVAEELLERHPQAEVLFVGGRQGREEEFARRAGLDFVGLPVRGMVGGGLRTLGRGFGLLRSLWMAWNLLRSFRPDVVLGFGGYAGFAPVVAAWIRGIPRAIHEQNCLPGASNRILGRLCRRVLLSFPDVNHVFNPRRTVLTGNPVRREIRALGSRGHDRPFGRRLLVFGGSQGARAINDKVLEALPVLAECGFEIWHQTGEADEERVRAACDALDWGGRRHRVEAFIHDMEEAYAWADLVLCRAGATTVSELAVAGLPSILVPYPHATHGHQDWNASYLEDAGAAAVLKQPILEEMDLAQALEAYVENPQRLERMAREARKLGRPDAASAVVDELERIALH